MYDNQNIFAKILRGEIPCQKLFENDIVLAFNDIEPVAPVHVLIIPKIACQSFHDFAVKGDVGDFFKAVQAIATQLGVEKTGYRLITNHGQDANQTVKHFHVHLIAGKDLGGLL